MTRTFPVLSLIIATRERADTLEFTLRTATDQASEQYEIVVSDNASVDHTAAVVRRHAEADRRVRYFRTPQRLSMCDNYEFALQQARGEYVVFIGDDDGVMPQAFDRLIDEIQRFARPTIMMWPLHVYDWPVDGQPARVAHLSPVGPRREVDLKRVARSVVANGGWRHGHLPSPYHCAVPRPMLDAIRSRTGRVFHSTQPDVFTAMALPAVADVAIDLGYTVTLNGRSARSNGRGFVAKSAMGNIDRFIREYGDYRFHNSLCPQFPAAANMIPDAVLLAKDMFPEVYDDTAFNYEAMWAYACRLRFASHLEVMKHLREIRACHPFRPSRFLRHVIWQEAAVVRRGLLTRHLQARQARMGATPSDIRAFVLSLTDRAN